MAGARPPNKRVVIGRYPRMTPDQARREAQKLLGRVAAGDDPAEQRAEARSMPTLGEAFDKYMAANPNRVANTVRLYRQNLRVNLGDWLKRPLDTITRQDVEDRFNHITAKHGWAGANQTLSMLRSIYRRPCVDHENLRNPVELWIAAGGRFNKMRRRRISGPAEVLPRWRAGIEALDLEPAVRDIFLIGFYTGMRRGEIVSLCWERIDLDQRILRVEETKTGEPLELPITRQLAAIFERRLEDIERPAAQPEGWVFPSSKSGTGHVAGVGHFYGDISEGRRHSILVPRTPQRLYHRGRARADVSTFADQTAGQSCSALRRDRGLRRGLVGGAASGTRAAHGRQDRCADARP